MKFIPVFFWLSIIPQNNKENKRNLPKFNSKKDSQPVEKILGCESFQILTNRARVNELIFLKSAQKKTVETVLRTPAVGLEPTTS